MVQAVQVVPEKHENSKSPTRLPQPGTNLSSISYEIYQPIVLLGKVLGLISWYSGHPGLRRSHYELWRKLVNILCKSTIFLLFLFLQTYKTILFFYYGHDSQVTVFVLHASSAINLGFIILVFVFCLFKENRFCILLQLSLGYDKVLKKKIKKINFCCKHAVLQLVFTALSIFSVLFYVGAGLPFNVFIAIFLSNYYVFATDLFVSVYFIFAAYLCSECFSELASDLNKVLDAELSSLNEELQEIRLNYEHLYRLAEAVQQAFSWLITLELAQLALILCSYLYLLLLLEDFQFIPIFIVTVIMCVYRTYTIAAAAGNITKQARLGLESLHHVHIKNLSYAEGFQITTLSNMLSQSPVAITAAGDLFQVNVNTFTTIMGTIVTYLIVLVQFRSPAPDLGIRSYPTKPNATH